MGGWPTHRAADTLFTHRGGKRYKRALKENEHSGKCPSLLHPASESICEESHGAITLKTFSCQRIKQSLTGWIRRTDKLKNLNPGTSLIFRFFTQV